MSPAMTDAYAGPFKEFDPDNGEPDEDNGTFESET